MITTLAISGLVGTVIGALTNDVAIRLIFRVLIPRKKPEIAAAVRGVVAGELMSPEKISAKLRAPKTRGLLEGNLRGLLDQYLDKDMASLDEILSTNQRAVDDMAESLRSLALDEAATRLADPELVEKSLVPLVSHELAAVLARRPNDLVPALDSLVDSIPGRVAAFLASDACRFRFIETASAMLKPVLRSPKPLRDALPTRLAAETAALLRAQAPMITELIARTLEAPDNQKLLRRAAKTAVEQMLAESIPATVRKTGQWLGEQVGIDIGKKISNLSGIEAKLAASVGALPDKIRDGGGDESARRHIEQMVGRMADDVLATPACELFAGVDDTKLAAAMEHLYSQLATPDTANSAG